MITVNFNDPNDPLVGLIRGISSMIATISVMAMITMLCPIAVEEESVVSLLFAMGFTILMVITGIISQLPLTKLAMLRELGQFFAGASSYWLAVSLMKPPLLWVDAIFLICTICIAGLYVRQYYFKI